MIVALAEELTYSYYSLYTPQQKGMFLCQALLDMKYLGGIKYDGAEETYWHHRSVGYHTMIHDMLHAYRPAFVEMVMRYCEALGYIISCERHDGEWRATVRSKCEGSPFFFRPLRTIATDVNDAVYLALLMARQISRLKGV